jgi:DNA-binding NarL/FixJ family response regulator
MVSDSAQLLAASEAEPVKLVFIDLATAGFDIALVVKQIHALKPQPRIVAFGPHVHRAKLSAARAAGCDCVLSRGEFYAQSDAILEKYHPSSEAD